MLLYDLIFVAPRWSPDGTKILFDTSIVSLRVLSKLYVSALDGAKELAASIVANGPLAVRVSKLSR